MDRNSKRKKSHYSKSNIKKRLIQILLISNAYRDKCVNIWRHVLWFVYATRCCHARAPSFACNPAHTAPDHDSPLCRWCADINVASSLSIQMAPGAKARPLDVHRQATPLGLTSVGAPISLFWVRFIQTAEISFLCREARINFRDTKKSAIF